MQLQKSLKLFRTVTDSGTSIYLSFLHLLVDLKSQPIQAFLLSFVRVAQNYLATWYQIKVVKMFVIM